MRVIQGIEFEANYDAGRWFAGVSGQHLIGQSVTTNPTLAAGCPAAPTSVGCAGAPLASIPPDQVSFLFGVRFLDRKLNLADALDGCRGKAAQPNSDNDRRNADRNIGSSNVRFDRRVTT